MTFSFTSFPIPEENFAVIRSPFQNVLSLILHSLSLYSDVLFSSDIAACDSLQVADHTATLLSTGLLRTSGLGFSPSSLVHIPPLFAFSVPPGNVSLSV